MPTEYHNINHLLLIIFILKTSSKLPRSKFYDVNDSIGNKLSRLHVHKLPNILIY